MHVHRYTVHTVCAQYRGKDMLTHTQDLKADTHTCRHIHTPPAQKPNQTNEIRTQWNFSEKLVNTFHGTMVCFFLVCHGFTHNSLLSVRFIGGGVVGALNLMTRRGSSMCWPPSSWEPVLMNANTPPTSHPENAPSSVCRSQPDGRQPPRDRAFIAVVINHRGHHRRPPTNFPDVY